MAVNNPSSTAAPRYDAKAKVTGAALYGSDHVFADALHAVLVASSIAKGRIVSFDLAAAKSVPGVTRVLTYEDLQGRIRPGKHLFEGGRVSNSIRPLDSEIIHYAGQIVAVVLGETYESAREAASCIVVKYDEITPSATFDCEGAVTQPLHVALPDFSDPGVGDFASAYRDAPVKIDSRYSTPAQHHNPMELFTVTCAWDGDQLTIHEPSHNNYIKKFGVAEQLGIDPSNVRVLSQYVGGGFGSKGTLTQRTAIIAVCAKLTGRPVRLVPTRQQGFTLVTYRAETRHRVQLAASTDGKLQALYHEGIEVTSRADPYAVAGTDATTRMYACPNIASKVDIVRTDRATPGFMRAPPEMPYYFALESAMDELAVALDMDPVELRRINDCDREPIRGLPYTSRSLMACFDHAAAAFRWKDRTPKPGSMRDGDWLIGWGCATSAYPTFAAACAARVRIFANGTAHVETAGHEVGQGQYTVAAQMVTERLGIPQDRITVSMGDTDLPAAPPAAGSMGTASICSAVAKACDGLLARLGVPAGTHVDLPGLLARRGLSQLEELAEWSPPGASPEAAKMLHAGRAWPLGGAALQDRIQFAFGAQFVEVRIHARTREIRVSRILGAFAAGRILNERTARSQYVGGMIWGISSALHEATQVDRRTARYLNSNLADYMIPVNADIGQVDVIMVPEEDKFIPLGAKGIGEIGIVGTAAAIANAVFHATGCRVRDLPIRIEKLL